MAVAFKKLINVLIHLAEADNHFAREEHDLILKILERNGIPASYYDEVRNSRQPIESLDDLPIALKFEYLFSSINLIFADKNVYSSEILFSKKIAVRLGFKKDLIDYCVEHYNHRSEDELKETTLTRYS